MERATPLMPAGIALDVVGIGSHHRQTVAGGDEEIAPQNHVAVAVAIGGGGEIDRVGPLCQGNQLVGVNQIGVGMTAAEVLSGVPLITVPGSAPSMSSRMRLA